MVTNEDVAKKILSECIIPNGERHNYFPIQQALDSKDAEWREKMQDKIDEAYPVGLINRLGKEIGKLTNELDDWRNTQKAVMSEKCPTDEVHCTCVPVLRNKLDELIGLRSFITENDEVFKALKEEIADLKVQLEAWFKAFGTTQLTHASCRLEQAEKEVADLKKKLEERKGLAYTHKQLKWYLAQSEHIHDAKVSKLTKALNEAREALEYIRDRSGKVTSRSIYHKALWTINKL